MQARIEMMRNLVYKTAWHLDRNDHMAVSDKVSMANYQANRLVCEAADLAIQVHGGIGYTRHKPFEHIYRHHRAPGWRGRDRKSTRLNSSHSQISYAVFCLKKKK